MPLPFVVSAKCGSGGRIDARSVRKVALPPSNYSNCDVKHRWSRDVDVTPSPSFLVDGIEKEPRLPWTPFSPSDLCTVSSLDSNYSNRSCRESRTPSWTGDYCKDISSSTDRERRKRKTRSSSHFPKTSPPLSPLDPWDFSLVHGPVDRSGVVEEG